MPKVVISYHPASLKPTASRLDDYFHNLGGITACVGVDGLITAGDDYLDALEAGVKNADAVLVLIGADWATDPAWLTNPDDYNRIALTAALQAKIRVVPILINDAALPAQALPETMQSLARRSAVSLRDDTFRADAARIVEALNLKPVAPVQPAPVPVPAAPLPIHTPPVPPVQPVSPSYGPGYGYVPPQTTVPGGERWPTSRKLSGILSILLLIALFLPWASCSSSSSYSSSAQNSKTAFSGAELMSAELQAKDKSLDLLLLFIVPITIAATFLACLFYFNGRRTAAWIYLIFGGLSFALMVIDTFRVLSPSSSSDSSEYRTELLSGWWLTLVLCGGVFVTGFIARSENRSIQHSAPPSLAPPGYR